MAKKRTTKTTKKKTHKAVASKRARAAKKAARPAKTKKPARKVAKPAGRKSATSKKARTAKTKKSVKKAVNRSTKKATRKAVKKVAQKKTVREATAKRKTASRSAESAARAASPRPKKVSSGLTARDIAGFREMLLAKRAELIGNVNNLHAEAMRQDASGDLSRMPIHQADIGTDNYEQEFTLGLIESERALLQEIEDALQRIVDKTYGLCAATGMPIGKKRLKASPWSKYSYEYKLAQEKGMMQRF